MAMSIDLDTCTTCGDCKPVCPSGAVRKSKGIFSIDAETCDECGGDPQCEPVCSAGSIHTA